MAYSTSNPPVLTNQAVGGVGKEWFYSSTDASTAVDASGYFTNGYQLGMRTGDFVRVIDSDASPVTQTIHVVTVSGTTVNLSDGIAAGSTNTD